MLKSRMISALIFLSSCMNAKSDTSPTRSIMLNEFHPAAAFHPNTTISSRRMSDFSGVEEDAVHPEDAGYIALFEQHFGVSFSRNLNDLPLQKSVSKIPWPSSYWPMADDGINAELKEGESSPVKKYAKAFNMDYHRMKDRISRLSGVKSQDGALRCVSSIGCPFRHVCSKQRGHPSGRCIPLWFGICHAWAPAAILEIEPKCPVKRNGVTFRVQDMKALMSQIYTDARVDTLFTGLRCDLKRPPTDVYGRYRDKSCRDLSPDFFHIITANMIGKLDKSFVIDKDAALEIWNQPIRGGMRSLIHILGYAVLEQRTLTSSKAMRYLSIHGKNYAFNPQAVSFVYFKTNLQWIDDYPNDEGATYNGRINEFTVTKAYEYILELDAFKTIIGGEWVSTSRKDHPDFLWIAKNRPPINTDVAGIKYANVLRLFKDSLNTRC